MRRQKGFFYPLLWIPTLVFIGVVVVGWAVYKRSHNNEQKKIDNSAQAQNVTPEASVNEPQTKNSPSPTPPSTQPPPDAPVSSGKYLKISPWGIKLKYTAEGNYTLKYFVDDDDIIYITTDKLEAFAKKHPECPEADRGTIYMRLRPNDYDYTGKQWSEESLKSIQAVKVSGYYYVKFAQQVCSTMMDGVSFETQQTYIDLAQKIPWHDVVTEL